MTAGDPAAVAPRAEGLGGRALAEILGRTHAAVVVLDGRRRVVYANLAGCRLLGQPLASLRGSDLLDHVLVDERARLAPYLDADTANSSATWSCALRGADGTEREVVGSSFALDAGDGPLVAVIVWDQSGPMAAARQGAGLAHAIAGDGVTSVDDVLAYAARYAVTGTRAVGCTVVVGGEEDTTVSSGAYSAADATSSDRLRLDPAGTSTAGDPSLERWVTALTAGALHVGDAAASPVMLTDADPVWRADAVARDHAVRVSRLPYRAATAVPLVWLDRLIGLCLLYLPPEVAVMTESELAFVGALADQAASALSHARLTARASETAALKERARLSRNLHDSVSQSLFAMTMHARAAQLALDDANPDVSAQLAGSLGEIAQLTRDASAEMRALIFELRPEALAEDGLATALHQQAAVLSAREGFTVTVVASGGRLTLSSELEEQLYRIGVEALNNIAKHARARAVTMLVGRVEDTVRLAISDDGVGFDPATPHPGHLGLSTMADRARAIGADLSVTSTPGVGTTVEIVVRLHSAAAPNY